MVKSVTYAGKKQEDKLEHHNAERDPDDYISGSVSIRNFIQDRRLINKVLSAQLASPVQVTARIHLILIVFELFDVVEMVLIE